MNYKAMIYDFSGHGICKETKTLTNVTEFKKSSLLLTDFEWKLATTSSGSPFPTHLQGR